MKKEVIIGVALIFVNLILLISSASADFWACFNKGEKIDFCNPNVDDRTATSDNYMVCMSKYNETEECFNSGNPGKCNQAGACLRFGNSSIDSEPPNITINSPEQDGIYDSRSVLLDIELDEEADIYYYDNINGRGRWTRVCSRCSPRSPAYSRKRSFDEGLNNLTFRAVDAMGYEALETRTFFVDSKKPRIHKTEPRSGYASGLFEVQYSEENLQNIVLFYGNNETEFNSKELSECSSGKKVWCDIFVDLSAYDGQRIEYYFIVTDIAGNEKKSQIRQNLRVDTTFPVLNNVDFWNYTNGSRHVYFIFNVTEENLDKIEYYDNNSTRPRWKTLCSRLQNGICDKRVPFSRGKHNLDIQITDRAGNAIAENIEFEVEY